MPSHENTSKYSSCELGCDRKVAPEFHVRATQRIERVLQLRAKEGLEASFASGDENMQMVRLKRGFYGCCKVGMGAEEKRMWNSVYLRKWL